MDLILEQGTPSDIAAATQQDQREDHLAEGEQDHSTNADQPNLLDHCLTLVSHLVPLDPGHCESEAVDHFLRVLGFGRQVSVMPSLADLDAMGLCAVHGSRAVAVRTGSRPLSPGDSLLGSGVS